jgi:hypothetical protein
MMYHLQSVLLPSTFVLVFRQFKINIINYLFCKYKFKSNDLPYFIIFIGYDDFDFDTYILLHYL